MHGIIHHMHSGSGDAPDEHGGETHRLYFAVYFTLDVSVAELRVSWLRGGVVRDNRGEKMHCKNLKKSTFKIGILKMVCDNWEVRGEGLSFCRVFPRESMTDVTTCDTLF